MTALYVDDPLLTAAAATAFDGQALAQSGARELKSFVKQAVGPNEAARVATHLVVGEPARVIRRTARRLRADLIVVGTKGLSGIGRTFFGSTTERVLRQSPVPVLAIPPAATGKIGRRWPGLRLLAGIDLDANAPSDARAVAAVAHAFNRPLTLVHVVEPNQLPPWLAGFASRDVEARAEAARTALARLVGALKGVRVDARVVVGDPSAHIPKLAKQAGADLIVLALRRSDGLFGAAQGTITYRVLSSGCAIPVLAMPRRGPTARSRASAAGRLRTGNVQLDPSAFT